MSQSNASNTIWATSALLNWSPASKSSIEHYPFHPDLTDIFYTKWTNLESFQRTRGIRRTFALALRDAERWDSSPLVATNVFLGAPGNSGLSESARELTSVAQTEEYEGKKQEWTGILEGELAKAREVQSEIAALRFREVEQAVFATFLHSQPIGRDARTRELLVLLGPPIPTRLRWKRHCIVGQRFPGSWMRVPFKTWRQNGAVRANYPDHGG